MTDPWFVVVTKPQQEGRAVENLLRQPQVASEVYWPRFRQNGRIRPLFPNYLFMRIPGENPRLTTVRSTFGCTGVLCIGVQPATVSGDEIDELRQREGPLGLVTLCQFKSGDDVLFGVIPAKFQEMLDEERCSVLFSIFGRSTHKILGLSEIRAAPAIAS